MNLNYDDHEAHHDAFRIKPCRHCGAAGAVAVVPGTGDHYAAVHCNTCGHFLEWLPWPPRSKEEQKRKRSKPLTILEEDACWFCGISKGDAALLGRKLERAHTVERARLIDAGLPADDPINLPVLCSKHHAEQHREREDLARFLKALGRLETKR